MATAKVIPFGSPAQFIPATITQLELELFLSLRNRLKQLEAEVELQESRLKTRLEAGAVIDPGVHLAALKESFRRSVAWKEVVIRLAERLKMDGEGYCNKVLAATKPDRSVKLIVE